MQRGFSLVELSIVLVILGLLTGGILAGQSLIRASELRAVTTERDRYVTAAQTFRDKYFAIPGDMNNATKFWGDDNAACPDGAVPNGTPGTCSGNGDGRINLAAAGGATGEAFQFWKQLALAGLIEGSYTGLASAAATDDTTIGTNVPRSKINSAGWYTQWFGDIPGDGAMYALDYGNPLVIAAPSGTGWIRAAVMKPEEAWNIDTKTDDGRPGFGNVVPRFWNNACATGGATQADRANSNYNLSVSSNQCMLFFVKAF